MLDLSIKGSIMILNINEHDQECLIAGLMMQKQYIVMSITDIKKNNPIPHNLAVRLSDLSIRGTRIDILLTKLNAKQESDYVITKG